MNPEIKRFNARYGAAADAIARLDIDQEVREQVATVLTGAFKDQPDFHHDLFWHLAADPLCECAGTDDGPCPHGRWIRIAMHLRDAPDGRSFAWKQRKPTVRCVTCGSKQRTLR